MFPFARRDSRPQWFGFQVFLKGAIWSIKSLSTPQRIYRAYRRRSLTIMKNYDISTFFPSRQVLFRCIALCVRFTLKWGNKSLPVEALVLPHLGPDVMLIDNSIMKSFGAKLDRTTAFQDSTDTIPAIHVRRYIKSKQCSVITQTATHSRFPYWFPENTLYQPHMKHSYEFPVRHDPKKNR